MSTAADSADSGAAVPVQYRAVWEDGFGARGWKLDVALDEPSVIAATAVTGERIPTSVLVHDILDHHLSGVAIGGHRNEAIALVQLASRTGADASLDYGQITDEDLLQGQCNGESLWSFLPDDLRRLAGDGGQEGKQLIETLQQRLGAGPLRERLVERFWEIGRAEQQHVEDRWRRSGLDYGRRGEMGLALQRLLAQADEEAREREWPTAAGVFRVGNRHCSLTLGAPRERHWVEPVA